MVSGRNSGRKKGSVEKRGPKYLLRVTLGTTPDGKRRRFTRLTDAKTEAQANKELRAFIAELEETDVFAGSMTLNQAIERWLDQHSGTAGTIQGHQLNYDNHIKESKIGKMQLAKLKTADINDFYQFKKKAGYVHGTISKYHQIIHGALNLAESEGLIARNVARLARVPKDAVKQEDKRIPNRDEARLLIASAYKKSPAFGTFVCLAAILGARPSELCALQWRDIDFEEGRVAIRRAVGRVKTEVKGTKTGKHRYPPLNETAQRIVWEHRKRCEGLAEFLGQELKDTDFVFFRNYDRSKPWSPSWPSHQFTRLKRSLDMEWCVLYDLRRFAATEANAAGFDPKVVAEYLGHSPQMLMNTYARATEQRSRDLAGFMGELVAGDSEE